MTIESIIKNLPVNKIELLCENNEELFTKIKEEILKKDALKKYPENKVFLLRNLFLSSPSVLGIRQLKESFIPDEVKEYLSEEEINFDNRDAIIQGLEALVSLYKAEKELVEAVNNGELTFDEEEDIDYEDIEAIEEARKRKRNAAAELRRKMATYWSGNVKTKWSPPPGLFAHGTAKEIANEIIANSPNLKTAMSRINFYINRAGKNLPPKRKAELEKVKDYIRQHYKKAA